MGPVIGYAKLSANCQNIEGEFGVAAALSPARDAPVLFPLSGHAPIEMGAEVKAGPFPDEDALRWHLDDLAIDGVTQVIRDCWL